MEYLFEFILELVLEGCFEASKSSKIPKWIRYPLIVFISLFCIAIIGLIFYTGFLSLKENILVGMLLLFIGFLMVIMTVVKLRKNYLMKLNK